jgi:hypothetical protein
VSVWVGGWGGVQNDRCGCGGGGCPLLGPIHPCTPGEEGGERGRQGQDDMRPSSSCSQVLATKQVCAGGTPPLDIDHLHCTVARRGQQLATTGPPAVHQPHAP